MFKGKSILCTICARGGSKGIKNKNIRKLLDKPLIAYSIEQAKATRICDHIIVSTDSNKVIEIAKKYGANIFFKRPAELATDDAPKLPVIKHAVIESEKYCGKKFDIVMDLDATSPLRNIEDIIHAMEVFIEKNYDNLITAAPARRSPYFNLVELTEGGKVVLSKPLQNSIVRRQDSPKCFDMNASIYIWKRDALLLNDTIFLEKTGLYIMPEERSIDIDSELDFEFVEFLMKKKLEETINVKR
jgi:CMP-N,N'-diacetyllegionaminic acid synthase